MSGKLIFIMIALAFGISLALLNQPLSEVVVTSDDTKAKNFAFTTIEGKEHLLSDFRGKIVFVNSWFSWCPPCVQEMPELLKLAEKHPDDLVFVAVSADKRMPDLLRYFDRLPEETQALTKLDNVHFVFDEGMIISRTILDVRSFPETRIIGRDGQQLYKISGVIDWLGPEVEKIFSGKMMSAAENKGHTHTQTR